MNNIFFQLSAGYYYGINDLSQLIVDILSNSLITCLSGNKIKTIKS